MRVQFQEGKDYHYWSRSIWGDAVLGSDPVEYVPVTKKQVQKALGQMFEQLKTRDYKLREGWKPYKLGGDEDRLRSAVIRMSKYVQNNGPTAPTYDPTWHQEYLYPKDTTKPRIDLENTIGSNLHE